MSTLNLGVIGNCTVSGLLDERASLLWHCLPRLDGDPVFYALVDGMPRDRQPGAWKFVLRGFVRSEQHYIPNTAVLCTRLYAGDGSAVEIVDFCPRFKTRGRVFRPQQLVRRIRPLSGTPRITVELSPRFGYGATAPTTTFGSNHIRYMGPERTLRLTTNAPVNYVLDGSPFLLDMPMSFVLGPDETLREGVEICARDFQEQTEQYWQLWVRRLSLPLEWQKEVIRAAITLKLCTYEDTGAIVAAMTTSIPEAADTKRNWDYRYCWLRDSFFVVRALNSLSEVETMENYLRYLANVVEASAGGHLQPVFGIALEQTLTEREATSLAGYRGMGPVRVGNQAHEHVQHDAYGNVILAASQAFFDERLLRKPTDADWRRLQAVGEQAWNLHKAPDAGMWELRTRARVHTSSSLMCWAACDRLAKIAEHRGERTMAAHWRLRADAIRAVIDTEAFSTTLNSYTESFGGSDVEAGLLLMPEGGYLHPTDPRFSGTLALIEKRLKRGSFLFRYAAADDFGMPETAFNICTFWYLDSLARIGHRQQAREMFETMLLRCNPLGLLSEDIHPETGELWGNFPQTYSLVGVINAAMRLSRPWESAV